MLPTTFYKNLKNPLIQGHIINPGNLYIPLPRHVSKYFLSFPQDMDAFPETYGIGNFTLQHWESIMNPHPPPRRPAKAQSPIHQPNERQYVSGLDCIHTKNCSTC